jgi:dTMP kinase
MIERQGLFVAIEGPDGVGKSAIATAVSEGLAQQGIRVTQTREPGGTALAEDLRRILLSPDLPLDPLTQALLFTAGRRDHVTQVIQPALASPGVVIVDRYLLSTLAYQGMADDLPMNTLLELHSMAVGLLPDLILSVDLPTDVILERLHARRKSEPGGINESCDRAGIDRRRASFQQSLQVLVKWCSEQSPVPHRLSAVFVDNNEPLAIASDQAIAIVHRAAKRHGVRLF